MKLLSRAAIILSSFLPVALLAAEPPPRISAGEAAKRVASGEAILIDVREPAEWAESGVAAPAVLLPMSDFNGKKESWRRFLAEHAGKQLILYCRTGNRSGKVASALAADGHDVANAGAFKDWQAAGLPTRQP